MAGKTLAVNVWVGDQLFLAGDSPEKKFADQITNPNAWGGDSVDESDDDTEVPYAKRKKADLEALVAERNADREDAAQIVVGGTGKVSDLAEALEADDKAQDSE